MSRDFPTLMVATEFPPSAAGGGPAVVCQLLKDWPTKKLIWWSCLPDQTPSAFPVHTHVVAKIPVKLYPHSKFIRTKAWILQNLWTRGAARHLQTSIREHQPAVIWLIPHMWSILPLAKILPVGKVPYHISMHDYPVHHADDNIGRNIGNYLLSQVELLYQRAASRDTISQEMADDLHSRTGQTANKIFNAGVEPEDFSYLDQKAQHARETIKIAHAGAIVAKETFFCFVESIRRIKDRLPRPVELHFYGPESCSAQSWFSSDWMIEHGNIPNEDFKLELQSSDWGVAAMDFTSENPLYNQISLPSKIVRYLAAGLGVITLGHRNSTIARFARKEGVGIHIEDPNPSKMDELLIQHLTEPDVWSRYRSPILACVRANFDALSMRKDLYHLLGVRD